ncbi:guanine nucleotide-binding protein subunit alpha-14-like, partial [Tropilaelaps mercedesae]
ETKFLLLGPPDVGKTTFMKQMRIINTAGYEEDLCAHVRSVFQDLVRSMQTIIRAMDLLGIPYQNPANIECAMIVSSVRLTDITTGEYGERNCIVDELNPMTKTVALPCNLAEALRRLWDDDGIQECYGRRIEYGLAEGSQHFVTNIGRITMPGYVPSQEDYLCIKTPSKGISEYSMIIDNEFPSRIVDVGEQKSETKKWIHCFEEVSGVIFMVSLSDYDNLEKMEESRKLFQLIASSNWFTESHILLLLNKKDVLEEKVGHGLPFGHFHPDFRGISTDAPSCREHIRRMFAQLEPDRPVYFFFTCATDTEDIKYVLPTLREIASVKTGVRSREPSDAASSTSAMAAVAAAMNGVSTAAAVGAIASPGPALVCAPTVVSTTTTPVTRHNHPSPPATPRTPQQVMPVLQLPTSGPQLSAQHQHGVVVSAAPPHRHRPGAISGSVRPLYIYRGFAHGAGGQ